MPLPLALAAPAVLNLVGGTVARQALMTGARSLITRGAGSALARSGVGRVLEGEFIAGSRAAGGLFRKNAGDVLEGQVIGGGLLQRLAKNKLAQNFAKGAGYALPFLGSLGRGTAKVAGKIGTGIALGASMFGRMGSALLGGGGGAGDGGQIISPSGGEGTSLAEIGGDATAFRGALPTLRTPSMPGLPGFRAKNKTGDCCGQECCEVTNRLLSIAVKYLAGIDATLKNQLDVQRASFTQENQAARESSLEKETLSGTGGGKIMAMVESTGKGMLSFLTKTLLMTLALSLPALVKKVSGVFEGIFEIVDDTIDKIKGFFGEEESAVTPTSSALGNGPQTRKGRGYKSTFDGTARSAIDRVLGREGGYVNDPADKGGETKFGISKRAYPNLDIKNLTQMQAAEIYKRDYWDAINADQLPENIREMAFDAAVNQGVSWTKEALKKSNNDPQKFLALREEKYKQIVAGDPSQAKFLKGWMNRLGEFSSPGNTMASTMVAATPTAASTISNAASAVSTSGSTTPPAVVVASNSPAPSSTSVNANGPGEPSSPYFDSTIMWTNYFTTGRA